jgi:RNA polymerase sigma-70 factor, ECF subfamily
VNPQRHFEQKVLPHLDAAYNLARWLTRNPSDAEDVVQDACVRAIRYLDALATEDARPWFLTIVRRAFYDFCARNRPDCVVADGGDLVDAAIDESAARPEDVVAAQVQSRCLAEAIAALPLAYRETLVLRELEDLSYKEIAAITGVPIGTVMSRLARARVLLQRAAPLELIRRERSASES